MATERNAIMEKLNSTDLSDLDSSRMDLDRAFKVLSAKLPHYSDLWDYYDGNQPLMYTARRMAKLFEDLEMASFSENWCAVVVDSANDKINLNGFTCENRKADQAIMEFWENHNMALEAKDIHEAAQVIGESYLLIWKNPEGESEIFYNDPRLAHLFYEPSNPRKKRYGAKWWVDAANHLRINLYYKDRLEYYRSDKQADKVTSIKSLQPFIPDGEADFSVANPFGKVPFFHFRPERRIVKSDMANAIPLQNGINKLITDLMVAAEFGAFKQRWIISNADTAKLVNAPNEIWEIPAGDGVGQSTQVGEFDATPLTNYIEAIDHLATSMAIITRTPKHYLFQQGGDPSGEALIAMESPLNKRCEDHIQQFTPIWKEAMSFLMEINGVQVDPKEIAATFDKPETIQPKTQAEIRAQGKTAGIPLKTLLRDEGKSDAWLDQMEKNRKEKKEAQADNMGAALMEAIRSANQPTEAQNDPSED